MFTTRFSYSMHPARPMLRGQNTYFLYYFFLEKRRCAASEVANYKIGARGAEEERAGASFRL